MVVLDTIFRNVLESVVVVLEGRGGSQNDPRGMVHNHPGGMSSKICSFPRDSANSLGAAHAAKFYAQIVCVVVFVLVTSFGMRRLAGL